MPSFKNILLFGTGGNTIGPHILQALVEDGTFNITVLARKSSKTIHPWTLSVITVDDHFPHEDLVRALQGQDVVVSCTGFNAVQQQYKLIDAAVEAGVQRFFPSEWGLDNGDSKVMEIGPVMEAKRKTALYLESKVKDHSSFSWTAVATGIWLEWALDVNFLDIDPVAHTAGYWNGGTHKPTQVTLAYSAKAALQLLKHPEIGKNQRVFLSGFEASQREIVSSLEKYQNVMYIGSDVNTDEVVRQARDAWNSKSDVLSAYKLVSAAILLPGLGGNFASSGKQPILEQFVAMPKITLDDVVRQWVEAQQ